MATEIERNDTARRRDGPTHRDLGLSGLTIPGEQGGRGQSAIEFALAVEEACRAMKSWMAGDILFATTRTGPSVIMISGNEAASARYLRLIASGERTAAIALSEPKHGSHKHDDVVVARSEASPIRTRDTTTTTRGRLSSIPLFIWGIGMTGPDSKLVAARVEPRSAGATAAEGRREREGR